MSGDEFLGIEEVADLFGVSPRTVRRWMQERGMPHIRVGNTLRFDRAPTVDWFRKQENE